MKQIPLTQGLFAIVDDVDYELLNQWKWYAHKNGRVFYATRHISKTKSLKMHQEIIGETPGFVCDHINGDGLDNRRDNLRTVTNRQNLQNRHVESSSKYPGVHWHKAIRRWQAQITINGYRKYLGVFISEEDAYATYLKAVSDL